MVAVDGQPSDFDGFTDVSHSGILVQLLRVRYCQYK